jgi:hypothetical protein
VFGEGSSVVLSEETVVLSEETVVLSEEKSVLRSLFVFLEFLDRQERSPRFLQHPSL